MDLQEERERDARLCAEADRVRRLEESHARLLAALQQSITSQGHTWGCKCAHHECVRREAAIDSAPAEQR